MKNATTLDEKPLQPNSKGFYTRVEDTTHALRVALSLPTDVAAHPTVIDAVNRLHEVARSKTDASGGASSILAGLSIGQSLFGSPADDKKAAGAAVFGARPGDNEFLGPVIASTDLGPADALTSTIFSREWSLLEDRLIVRLDDNRSDLLTGYAHQHRIDPVNFPKKLTEDGALRARVQELKTHAVDRLTFLRAIPDELVGMYADELREITNHSSGSGGAATTSAGGQSYFSLDSTSTSNNNNDQSLPELNAFASSTFDASHTVSFKAGQSPTNADGLMSPDKKSSSGRPSRSSISNRRHSKFSILSQRGSTSTALNAVFGGAASKSGNAIVEDDMVLKCMAREDLQDSEITCHSKDILHMSPFLADLYRQAEQEQQQNHAVGAGFKQIHLSERDPMWTSIPAMHQVFGADNVLRFKTFCQNPKALEELENLKAKSKAAKDHQSQNWDNFVTAMTKCQRAHLNNLKERTVHHEEAITQQLTACMEKDIAAIKAIYEAHIDAEVKKMKRKADLEKQKIEQYFDKDTNFLRAMIDCYSEPEVGDVLSEVDLLEEAVNELFPPASLPRLLMLSDILLCSELRSACIKRITEGFFKNDFISDVQMSSELLRANTLRELVAHLTDEQLLSASRRDKKAQSGVPYTIVSEEVEKRKLSRLADLRAFSTDELNALMVELTTAAGSPKSKGVKSISRKPKSKTTTTTDEDGSPLLDTADISSPKSAGSGQGKQANTTEEAADPTSIELKTVDPAQQYAPWRELVLSVLGERQRRQTSSTNISALRLPKASVPFAELDKHTRRVVEVMASYRYVNVEGCGAIRCGETTHKVYFECRIATADRKNPVSFYLGYNVVARSLTGGPNTSTAAAAAKRLQQQQQAQQGNKPGTAAAMSDDAEKDAGSCAVFTSAGSGTAWAPSFNIVGVTPVVKQKETMSGLPSALTTPTAAASSETEEFYGVSMCEDGVFYCNGIPHESPVTFSIGDIVGVGLDCYTGIVSFYKNGVPIPPPHGVSLTLPVRHCAVVPSLTVYSAAPATAGAGGANAVPSGGLGGTAALEQSVASVHSTGGLISGGTAAKKMPEKVSAKARAEFFFEGNFNHQVPQGYQAFSRHAVPVNSLFV